MSSITFERYLTEDFFSLIGLDDLPDEKKAEFLEKINRNVLAQVYLAIYNELSEEERVEYDTVSADQMVDWLHEHGFQVEQMVFEESMRYRLELAKSFEMAAAALNPATA